MNCKPGDLAEYVGGDIWAIDAYIGKRFIVLSANVPDIDGAAYWWVQPVFDAKKGDCADRHLRPIRPTDGQDETLTWKALPRTPEVTV